MVFHTVGVYGFNDSPQHEHYTIAAVWLSSVKFHKLTTYPCVSNFKQHMIPVFYRKKGCDDPYGNGQRPDVWQDHA